MRILIDMDMIIVGLLQPWIEEYNLGRVPLQQLKMEDIYLWDIHKCTHDQDEEIYDIIGRPGWFRNLLPLKGALAAIEKLQLNNECFIVSTPSSPDSYKDKIEWLGQHMPSFTKKNIILTGAKHLINGDVLIDDSPANAEAYRKAWPKSKILTIKYPYNKECKTYDLIANNWKHTDVAWETILDYLDI
jgi:5'(3')-deoxyribonucleotidase